ncbi:adenylyl-sulfate kinase [Granulicella arctica]|uniref:adenylyl-sulfate kinase n=1 Tax=Granulicella arctica TaxID=940613 RepID=UPI0021DF8A48|nr:adenylyl-sulfate kinase [Granulicella arctica]
MLTRHGHVIWFTGLSGSGKSTLCASTAVLLAAQMRPVQILDADKVREELCSDLGFSLDDRFENVRRLTYVAKLLAQNGIVVLVAAISPLNTMREMVRSTIPDVIDIFVDAPLAACEFRDPKGLYRRARKGLITQVTGIDSPFEPPSNPTVTCHTAIESIAESTQKVFAALESREGISVSIPSSRRKTLAVDFDGVIADYTGWKGEGVHGLPRRDVLEALAALQREGWKIVIHTTRSETDIRNYLINHKVPYDEINRNSDYRNLGDKPVATIYWDDRALRYSGDATRDLRTIRQFATWSGRE